MPTWQDVVVIATRFPGVEETTSFNTPSLKVGKRFLARLRTNPDALVIKTTDLQEREALLEGRPDVFFRTTTATPQCSSTSSGSRPSFSRSSWRTRGGRMPSSDTAQSTTRAADRGHRSVIRRGRERSDVPSAARIDTA